MIRRLLALCALLFAAPAAAQGPLTLDQVLRSSAQNAPQIIEALAKQRQAEGKALSAEGAFDVVFDVDAQARAFGYYDGSVIEAKAPFLSWV